MTAGFPPGELLRELAAAARFSVRTVFAAMVVVSASNVAFAQISMSGSGQNHTNNPPLDRCTNSILWPRQTIKDPTATIRLCTAAAQWAFATPHQQAVAYAMRALGRLALDAQDKSGNAMADALRAEDIDDGTAEGFLAEGEVYLDKADPNSCQNEHCPWFAAAAFLQANDFVKQLPADMRAMAWYGLGAGESWQCRFPEEEDGFTPSHAAWLVRQSCEESLDSFAKAIKLDRTNPAYYRARAELEAHLGQAGRANADFNAAAIYASEGNTDTSSNAH